MLIYGSLLDIIKLPHLRLKIVLINEIEISHMDFLSHMLTDFEKPSLVKYSGRYETHFWFYSLLLFCLYQILAVSSGFKSSYGMSILDAPFRDGLGYLLYTVPISTVCYLTIIMVATPFGDRWIRKELEEKKGLTIIIFVVLSCFLYQVIGMGIGFPRMIEKWNDATSNIFLSEIHWFVGVLLECLVLWLGLQATFHLAFLRDDRKGLFRILKSILPRKDTKDKKVDIEKENVAKDVDGQGTINQNGSFQKQEKIFSIYFMGFLLISPIMVLQFDLGDLSWLAAFAPLVLIILFSLAKSPMFNQNKDGLTIGDILITALGAGVLMLFQTTLELSWCFSLPIAAVLMMYTTRLGREHFHFSFVPKTGDELPELINTVLFTIATFIPIAILVGFIDPADTWNPHVTGETLVKYMAIWIYVVGIAEEFIFRCGVLILIADGVKYWAKKSNWEEKGGIWQKMALRPMTTGLILSAIIFGLSHAPKGWDYAFLAILAGFIYGIPFCKNKNLFGAVVLHAIVDVIAVAYFGAQL
jgi:membrane protease YdiL (CAAX protease family)